MHLLFHHFSLALSAMYTDDKPIVLIVGAGLGGLMLGSLPEKSNVPYAIFKRARSVKPLSK
jgi:cation diffusion facilitator CzcD-associated flavoprotein CzcO